MDVLNATLTYVDSYIVLNKQHIFKIRVHGGL